MVGDKGKDQIVNLHFILAKARLKAKPNVLWCYKKDLGFSSHRKKRERQIKREISRGLRKADESDPFELFITTSNIRYCYYRDSAQILGKTYGMLILSDFHALTPNLLARTVETVEGGGIVVILLKTMKSLKQLYHISMDVHKRYRTEAHADVVGRFNERFLLSLTNCENCLVIDDELNILPISSKNKHIKPKHEVSSSAKAKDLKELKADMRETEIIGDLVKCCLTLDQAKCVLTFIEAVEEKTLKSTVTLTAGRGRGKSAALGFSLAAAIAYDYSNIFVTAPSPENLSTVFEMLIKGLKALGMQEHRDYTVVQSTNQQFNNAIIRVNVFKDHRQTVQYIRPQDKHFLGQAEILVIDEAAAIPLPVVKNLFGPYLVFMSSTVNGYEGTGRSLSLKLIKQLKKKASGKHGSGRSLRELELEEPIRYAQDDPVETWLTDLLCLDCTGQNHRISYGTPALDACQLYYVNRDTLFSYNKVSEAFLQRMMSLYVSSHYKNSPNDLQLMSDAPAHHLFVLLGPQKSDAEIPDIIAVIQCAAEGALNKKTVALNLLRGERPSGDMIPWTISSQFQDIDFGRLSGMRVVRIAVHPDLQRMGYGSRALQLLRDYYQGALEMDADVMEGSGSIKKVDEKSSSLSAEQLSPRSNLPPILTPVTKRIPEAIHYLGVSFGLTFQLFKFWKRAGFESVYLRQTQNKITGEHTIMMLKSLSQPDFIPDGWLQTYTKDFRKRLMQLSSIAFNKFQTKLSLIVLDPPEYLLDGSKKKNETNFKFEDLEKVFSTWDLKRLESYSNRRADYHLILDLTPKLAELFFSSKLPLNMSFMQCAILNAVGLQRRGVDEINKDLKIPVNQILALFTKTILKFVKHFNKLEQEHERAKIPKKVPKNVGMKPVKESLETDLSNAAEAMEVKRKKKKKKKQQAEVLSKLDLSEYQISGNTEQWAEALKQTKGDKVTLVNAPNAGSKRKRDENGKKIKKKQKKNKKKKKKRVASG